MAIKQVVVPYKFTPRDYQLDLFKAIDSGKNRAAILWHRRAGKDKACFNIVVKRAVKEKGNYYYFFPNYTQAKKAIWDAIDSRTGDKFLDHIPREIIKGLPNQTELKVTLKTGSTIQLIGADNIDSIMGTPPRGCVFSEYALQDPKAWDYISPILLENGGWALFPYTPRGKNHGFKLFQAAQQMPEKWFTQVLTVKDTYGRGGTMSPEAVESERREMALTKGEDAANAFIDQEYYCSFDAAIPGAYYAGQLASARADSRVTDVAYDSALRVNTYWDLGYGDATSIWFAQLSPFGQIRIIDFYESSGASLDHYAKVLQGKPYVYGTHFAPHDAEAKEIRTGKSIQEIGWSLGLDFEIVTRHSVDDGINAARMVFNRCWFDEKKCQKGLDALAFYHKEWDDNRQDWKQKPEHDWSSHAADAFRYLAMSVTDQSQLKKGDRYSRVMKHVRSFMSA